MDVVNKLQKGGCPKQTQLEEMCQKKLKKGGGVEQTPRGGCLINLKEVGVHWINSWKEGSLNKLKEWRFSTPTPRRGMN